MSYTIKDLETWDEKIRVLVDKFGLDPFPQIFEECDHNQMIGYMSYSGMPSRYPHWSYGKQYEKQKTLYNYGLTGLPYEMVINSNPCLAYLMKDNTLLLQILTMAHVYGHNDFFRHNFTFRHTHPEYTLEKFKSHSVRVRKYIENPHIGLRKVENALDAAHALSMNCTRYMSVKKETGLGYSSPKKEPKKQCGSGCQGKCDGASDTSHDHHESEVRRNPAVPDEDLLLFIRDNNPFMEDWEKDLLTIVHDETSYFIPQIQTKIMNEGWASLWHKRILEALDLPEELRMELYVRHNQVLRPIPRSLNPYYLGYKILEDIERRWNKENGIDIDGGSAEYLAGTNWEVTPGHERLFQVRETDRDDSFLRQYLTKELMIEMDLYVHEDKGRDRVVTKVASDQDWKNVRDTIIASSGTNSLPVIKVFDADYKGRGRLLLIHEFDGRDLDSEYAKKTLRHVYQLWRGPVILETKQKRSTVQYICESEKGSIDIKSVPNRST